MRCDCGAVQKLKYVMILAGFDKVFGEAGVEIGAGLFAPAADGQFAQVSEQTVA